MTRSFLDDLEWGCTIGLNNILLPIKGFPAEGDAITLAFFLAECANAKIWILHVEEEEEEEEEPLLEDLYDEISVYAEELKITVDLDTVEGDGSIEELILKKSDEIDADLIVMGAQRIKLTRELLGTSTYEVARRAEVPVFIVFTPFEDWTAYRRVKIRRILVPYRTLGDDKAALKLTTAMASSAYSVISPNIEIHLAHVVELPDILPLNATSPEIQQEKKEFLRNVGELSCVIGEPLIPRIIIGRDFSKSIVELTKKLNFDLLVVGAKHRPRGFGGLIGTDVYNIAKLAYCTTAVIFR
ncbi:universal stress protein [Candidatus Borrarchaeum sp.]|uniref:universal stress protein n=1 Tax=Candidatus Borrarchaeum sp. TaxID=2846742 RepID=UPI0025801AAC|nr:universal stress protein [Candidatus Borrarchaeum sp.]